MGMDDRLMKGSKINMSQKEKGSLSIIIPSYNEEDALTPLVEGLRVAFEKVCPQYEIIIVDDGSSDNTGKVADGLSEKYPRVRVVHHENNLGQGMALRTGFENAEMNLITSAPGDGQIAPSQVVKVYENMDEDIDVVSTYYFKRADTSYRIFLSKGLRAFLWILFGSFPRLEGIRIFRKELLDKINFVSISGFVNLEFIIKAHKKGYRIKTIPIESTPRKYGQSKVNNFSTIVKWFFEAIKLRMKLWFN